MASGVVIRLHAQCGGLAGPATQCALGLLPYGSMCCLHFVAAFSSVALAQSHHNLLPVPLVEELHKRTHHCACEPHSPQLCSSRTFPEQLWLMCPAYCPVNCMQNTAETVRQLQQQHAAETAALQRQIQLLAALAQPDPVPQPWVLNLRAEASKYFLTELETEPSGQALGPLLAY